MVRIKVTQEHIDKGYWGNPLNSPITLALKEAGFKSIEVFHYRAYIGRHKIPLPEGLQFPKHEPFEFEIKLPLFLRLEVALTEALNWL